MIINTSIKDFAERYRELEKRLHEDTRRKTHDRIQVVVTGCNAPSDEPADYFWVQFKATNRLRQAMGKYHEVCEPLNRGEFTDAPG